MKRILIFILISFWALSAKATNCADFYYIEGDVAIYVCKNYGRGIENVNLYYKGVVKALNDYLHLRQERGELEKKKLHISISDPIMSTPCYEFSQSSKDYYISLYGDKTLEQLMVYLDQFSKPGFIASEIYRPFGVPESEEADRMERAYDRREKELNAIRLPTKDIKAMKEKKHILWQKNGMQVTYQDDKINCYLGDKKIKAQLFSYPWVIQDRFVLQNAYRLDVYTQDGEMMKSYKYCDENSFDDGFFSEVEVYNRWINFLNINGITISYSYDKNKFYKMERK